MSGGWLVIGANGAVGRLLRRAWRERDGVGWCARRDVPLSWRLQDGAAALAAHMAGRSDVLVLAGATRGDPAALSLNAEIATAAVAAAARVPGAPHLWLASSMAVYGPHPGPHAEDGPARALAPYGRAKLEMEDRALGAAQNAGVGVTCLRLGNVVGADLLFRNIAAGRDIVIDAFADGGTPRRSYVDPVALGAALDDLARLPRDARPDRLNLAAGPPLAMGDLARAAGVRYDTRQAPEGALPVVEMDLSRAISLSPALRDPRDAATAVGALQSLGACP